MDRLISFDSSNPVQVKIEQGQPCSGYLTLLNVMHTMPVAFRIQPINPSKYTVRPASGIIFPLTKVKVEIVYLMAPNMQLLPEFPNFPFDDDSFRLHSLVVPGAVAKDAATNSVPLEWFTTRRKQVFIDSGIAIVFVGASVLVKLVMNGDMEKVREVIEISGSDSVNSVDKSGRSLLHLAVMKNRADLVQMLLEFEPDINLCSSSGLSPLESAAASGDALIVELLLAHGARMDRSGASAMGAVHLAARQGHMEVLKLLLLKGADVESTMKDGSTALHIATEERRKDCVKLLLASGANPNVSNFAGDTPLHVAAAQGDKHLVNILLQKGANKWVINKFGKMAYDLTVEQGHIKLFDTLKLGDDLSIAAKSGEVGRVERLIENGALINGKDQYNWTALHRASFKGNTELVRFLIEKGIEIDSKDDQGYTALHCATESGFPEVVELLVKRGADVNARTNKGITALHIAENLNFAGITRVLVQGGASRDGVKASVVYENSFHSNKKIPESKGFKKVKSVRTRTRGNNMERLSAPPLSVI